jgi:hypothetical protein
MQIRGRQEERYGLCDKVNTNLWVPQPFVPYRYFIFMFANVKSPLFFSFFWHSINNIVKVN